MFDPCLILLHNENSHPPQKLLGTSSGRGGGAVAQAASELHFLEMIVKKMTVMDATLDRAVNAAAGGLDCVGN